MDKKAKAEAKRLRRSKKKEGGDGENETAQQNDSPDLTEGTPDVSDETTNDGTLGF